MVRESAGTVAGKMLRVLNLVNALAADPACADGIALDAFARRLDMGSVEVERLIRKINLGCGEVLPELFVDFDPETGLVVPHAVGFALDQPLRLTANEARGLLTALESSGIDQADTVFAKIEGAFPPVDRARFDAIRNATALGGLSGALANITRAINARNPIDISYRGLADTTTSQRVIEPRELTYDAREQAWYLCAYCRTAKGWRTFRIDRIERLEVIQSERFEQVDDPQAPHGLAPIDDAPMAVLAVYDPRAVSDTRTWRGLVPVECPLPHDARKVADKPGAYIAAVPWSQGSPWLPQAVAQALGGVEVLRPFELRQLAHNAACELLDCLFVDTM